jgi:predicted metal-dependent phosphoesterase TrpH
MLKTMHADLHTHTNASDGMLSPQELIALAQKAGVRLLSITDHDTIAAYQSAPPVQDDAFTLIPGVEFSSVWNKMGIHIVGLNVQTDHPTLLAGIDTQQTARNKRAEMIAARLTKLGFTDTLSGARDIAGSASLGRPHFAAWLVNSGQISDEKTAFKKYLGQGKACDIKTVWPQMKTVIEWITAAGGKAILAHPAKYKLTNRKLEELVSAFTADGGHGMEVICGKQIPDLSARLAKLANRHGLLASCGSDFHRLGQHWAEPGCIPELPAGCRPVWENW